MNPFTLSPRHAVTAGILFALSGGSAWAAVKAPAPVQQAPVPVEALLYSTMPSTAAHRPEMAMDGSGQTYFRSTGGMGDGDDFLVLLSRPIPMQSIQVTTGDTDGQDLLTGGLLEVSSDGTHFRKAADFDGAGVANAMLGQTLVMALRIRLNPDASVPALLVREITIASRIPIARTLIGPGRGFVDLSQAAPDQRAGLPDWARRAETQMEESWADTAALLYTDKFLTPNMVNVVYRTGPDVTGVAATGGGVMTVNTAWCLGHPKDTGLTVHETAHVIQAYSTYNPVWLVEGIADYIRWVKFEPENFHPRINVQKATYHDSYQTTATFLGWCELHYDSALVTKLSRAIRSGTYNVRMFQTYCGKDVDTLWSEFIAAYKADPATIITPPLAAADQPRTLPIVTAGTSAPVDLSKAFNAVGIFNDGETVLNAGGVDGEGNGYSAQTLGAAPRWENVSFRVGTANVANVISCHGDVIPLPPSSHGSLWLLGTAVEGSQKNQALTVTYTDGTTASLVQNFSDWFQPARFPGESRAVKMPYRNTATGSKDARTFYVYSYGFPLDRAKTVKSVTLPDNAFIKILGITLAG